MYRSLVFLLLSAAPAAAQSTTVLQSFAGDSPGDELGRSVAAPGDVDGDGVDDLAMGSPGDTVRHVRIFSGADGAFLHSLVGVTPGDGFGESIAAVGDADGDLRGDLAVAAPGGGTVSLHSLAKKSTLWTWSGPATKVSRAGDVSGDGVPDVLVLTLGGGNDVFVLSGADGSVVLQIGPGAQWHYVDGGEDVDGDGTPDIVVGNPWYPDKSYPYAVPGQVQVHSGADGSVLYTKVGQGLFNVGLGWGVALLGDADGDGFGDIAAGWSADLVFHDPAHAVVWSGKDGSMLKLITSQSGFGLGVFRAGDLDQDGLADLYVVDSGGVKAFSSATWTQLYQSMWECAGLDMFDPAMAALGNLDSSGHPDILTGAPACGTSGGAFVLSPCGWPQTYCVGAPNSAWASGAQIGWSGMTSVTNNNFDLRADFLPPHMAGLFVYASDQAQVPFANGFLCLSGGSLGFFRILPVVNTGACCGVIVPIDFNAPQFSQGAGALVPGSAWNFQFWYRDTPAGGAGSNLSDALSVDFCQ